MLIRQGALSDLHEIESSPSRRFHLLTAHDVVANDLYVSISIRPGVFVPEANDMAQFMNDYTKLVTVFPDTDCLRSVTSFPNEGTASGDGVGVKHEDISQRNVLSEIDLHV